MTRISVFSFEGRMARLRTLAVILLCLAIGPAVAQQGGGAAWGTDAIPAQPRGAPAQVGPAPRLEGGPSLQPPNTTIVPRSETRPAAAGGPGPIQLVALLTED